MRHLEAARGPPFAAREPARHGTRHRSYRPMARPPRLFRGLCILRTLCPEKEVEYWLARLLEREARGRFVQARLKAQFEGPLRFQHQGVDVVDPANGRKYEILSGTESNLARHGRRMAGEFFRMLTF